MAEIDARTLLDIINGIVAPVQVSLTRQVEAMQTVLLSVNRVAEIVQQEPTRATIIAKVSEAIERLSDDQTEALQEHDTHCERRGQTWNTEDIRRAEDILRKATDTMDEFFEKHNEAVAATLKPVEELTEAFNQTKARVTGFMWVVGAAGTAVMTMGGYLAWALAHIPAPVAKAAGAAIGQ